MEVEYNQLGNGIRSYGWSLTALTLLAALACGIWTYRNRTTSVVRASQPFFLILISVGVFIFGTSIIPMAIDDGNFSVEACDKACMAVPWLTSIGWSILFSALYAKIKRVNIVVNNVKNFRQVKVSEKDVMTPFAILFTANLILLVVWTLVDPMFWKRIEVSPTESYGTCSAGSDSVAWKIILAVLATLNGAALVGANVEAWKARKIDTEYGESSYIGLIMASILQVVLVGVPLSFLVQDNPTARFFVNSSMAFVVSMSALSLLFLPKVINLYESQKHTKGSKGSSGQQSSFRAASVTETAMMEDLKSRVKNLQHLLIEAGIDGSTYIHQAGLDDFGYTNASHRHVLSSLSQDLDPSSRFESLPPVAEADDEDATENDGGLSRMIPEAPFDRPKSPKIFDRPKSPKPPRSSVSRWLEKKKSTTPVASAPAPNSHDVDPGSSGFSVKSTETTLSRDALSQSANYIAGLMPAADLDTSLKERIEESMRPGLDSSLD